MESTSAQVIEMVEMIPVTRAHALEEKEATHMSEQLQMVAAQGYRLDIIQSTFGSLTLPMPKGRGFLLPATT